MALLTREQILSANDRDRYDVVAVPEWGGEVRLRVIGGDERDQFDMYRASQSGEMGIRAFLVAMAACDADGKPLFSPSDVRELGRKSSAALDRLWNAARKLNGIGEEAVEDLEKNSPGGQSESSGCTSHEPSPIPASEKPND